MGDDRHPLEQALVEALHRLDAGPPPGRGPDGPVLAPALLQGLYDDMVTSRQLDHAARWLRAGGHGFYTIGSAGHESNAIVAAALRPTDPALLHYRSGGFYAARARQVPGVDAVTDVLLGVLAAVDEPIAGGRHKVFGRAELSIIPQTSTIASHLPRAVGVARAIALAARTGTEVHWPLDAIVVCSFGDASANHSTATGAINAACWFAWRGDPLPLLFVCEDNGIGISVPTPPGWVAAAYAERAGLRYAAADGHDPAAVWAAATTLAGHVRTHRRPAFLHLRTVRFLGHAGTDVEAAYRSPEAIRADYGRDPILGVAGAVVAAGAATGRTLAERYDEVGRAVRAAALGLVGRRRLASAAEVMGPLAPRSPAAVAAVAAMAPPAGDDRPGAGDEPPGGSTFAQAVNTALGELLALHPGLLVFGEDVGAKGGVYGVTRGLQRRFGPDRVFDTLLDEQTILGLALGTAVSGFVPVPEVQYLAYLHNAEDQLRGEAASLSFFSNGRYRNGMVVRIEGYAYQKGFGGHFHNDDSVTVLRDIPGVVVASPARPADAAAMLRTCVAAAVVDGTVSVFLEPIALYHTQDLHDPGDGGWLDPYPAAGPGSHVPIGAPRLHGVGDDLLVVTWANGLYLSLRAARRLRDAYGVRVRVLDVRWLVPLPHDDIATHAADCGAVLIVDETRRSGGVGEAIVADLAERGLGVAVRRLGARDSFVPLGDAAELVLVSEGDIVAAALALAR